MTHVSSLLLSYFKASWGLNFAHSQQTELLFGILGSILHILQSVSKNRIYSQVHVVMENWNILHLLENICKFF